MTELTAVLPNSVTAPGSDPTGNRRHAVSHLLLQGRGGIFMPSCPQDLARAWRCVGRRLVFAAFRRTALGSEAGREWTGGSEGSWFFALIHRTLCLGLGQEGRKMPNPPSRPSGSEVCSARRGFVVAVAVELLCEKRRSSISWRYLRPKYCRASGARGT